MASRVFEQVLRFFGTIATALTGLGALCTAAGFLAERTRWSMLGFAAAPADLNEYLFTGARFLAFLPGIALTSVLTAAAASVTAFLLAVTLIGGVLLVRRWRARRRNGEPVLAPAPERPWLRRARPGALLALALFQFAGTMVLFQAGQLRNVLFTDRAPLAGAECGRAGVSLQSEVLLGCEAELTEHLGRVFLIVLFSGGALWLLLPASVRRAGDPDPLAPAEPAHLPLLGINLALLAVQLILLPINYGALFLRNEFALVEVTLAQPELRAERWPVDGRFSLLHRRDDEFYLYAPSARRIWLVPRGDMQTLTYLGICGVFDPADSCHSDAPPLQTLEVRP
jgi:hypothetical protein